jgi:hypothetical protein
MDRDVPPLLTEFSKSADTALEEGFMRAKLLLAAFCIIAFPLLFSASQYAQNQYPVPYSSIAFAGRIPLSGAWCQCGCAECICDPGETPSDCPGGNNLKKVSDKDQRSDQATSPISNPASGIDFGSGALLLALTLFLWSRLRAY